MYREKRTQALPGRNLGRDISVDSEPMVLANGASSLGESLLAETAFQKPIGRRSSCLKKSIAQLKVTFNLGVFLQKCRYLLMQTRF